VYDIAVPPVLDSAGNRDELPVYWVYPKAEGFESEGTQERFGIRWVKDHQRDNLVAIKPESGMAGPPLYDAIVGLPEWALSRRQDSQAGQ
jgi:hypothetical protein